MRLLGCLFSFPSIYGVPPHITLVPIDEWYDAQPSMLVSTHELTIDLLHVAIPAVLSIGMYADHRSLDRVNAIVRILHYNDLTIPASFPAIADWTLMTETAIHIALDNDAVWSDTEKHNYLAQTIPFVHAYFHAMFHLKINNYIDFFEIHNYLLTAVEFNFIPNMVWYLRLPDEDGPVIYFPFIRSRPFVEVATYIVTAVESILRSDVHAPKLMADLFGYLELFHTIRFPNNPFHRLCTTYDDIIRDLIFSILLEQDADNCASQSQLSAHLVQVCKLWLPMATRAAMIAPMKLTANKIDIPVFVSPLVSQSTMYHLLLQSLAHMDQHRLGNGIIVVPNRPVNFGHMLLHIATHYLPLIDAFFLVYTPENILILRAIGRLLGLCIAQGIPEVKQFIKISFTPISVPDTLFRANPFIRAGVYDIYPENIFERFLIDGMHIVEYIDLIHI